MRYFAASTAYPWPNGINTQQRDRTQGEKCNNDARFFHCHVESKRRRIRRVKHWRIALAILAALSASIALADDFKTVNGKEYKNATVSRVEPDGIVLRSKSGIAKVYFTELPKDVQQRFGYDPEKIAALQRQAAESQQQQQAESASAVIRAQEKTEIISALADRSDDKIKAVLNSPQMQKARKASNSEEQFLKNSEEQIALIKDSDLYKRGYAKQSTAVKITVSDAERNFAGAESEWRIEHSVSWDLIQGAGLEEMQKHLDRRIALMGALGDTKQRLFDLYALIMKDGE